MSINSIASEKMFHFSRYFLFLQMVPSIFQSQKHTNWSLSIDFPQLAKLTQLLIGHPHILFIGLLITALLIQWH